MFARIVVVAFQNIAERRARLAVHQVAIQSSLESLELALVPRHAHFCVLNVTPNLQTRALEMDGMKFRGIIDNNHFRCPVAFPRVLDGRELTRDINLGENRVFEAPHHRQTTGWLEASVEAREATSVLIES